MPTCVVRPSSPSVMSNINHPRRLLRAATHDSSSMPAMTCRKRLLSEQCDDCNDDILTNKKVKRESLANDSNDNNNQHHALSFSFHSLFENTTQCPSSPDYIRRKSLIRINSTPLFQSTTLSPPSSLLSTTTTTTSAKKMLFHPQTSLIDSNENDQEKKNNASIYLTSSQLTAYIASTINPSNGKLLLVDCGSPLRHNERRIKDSILLNINDKLSRKRLVNRGLKQFLDQNQFERLTEAEIIVLYADSIQTLPCSLPTQLSPIVQCVFEQIKRYDSEKTIYVLQSSFEEFYQHFPTLCYVSLFSDEQHESPPPSPTLDVDSYRMSEVLPGLYLGNAQDAKDLTLLQENQIKAIINISKTIPCYYKEENLFDYLQLPCHDSVQENLLPYFEKTFDYIREKLAAKENVLVHCQGGVSRSPSFVIGYLIKYHAKTFNQAYTLVKGKRKIINPNLNFHTQLTRYETMMQ